MKLSILLSAAVLLTPPAYAFEINGIRAADIRADENSIPVPAPAVPAASAEFEKTLDGQYLCYGNSCSITTAVTNVCSDGIKIDTWRKKTDDKKNDAEYKDETLRKWAGYQRGIGQNAKWRDPNHQDTTATGQVNPITTAYAVVPRNHRELLNTTAKVCVLATGKCITAEVRKIGPAFGEISVGAFMQLGLNAHPSDGQYTGRISYTFQ